MHNGPAGAGGWPLFILGMLMILTGLALIAPPPSAEAQPPSPGGRLSAGATRLSHREEDGDANGAPAAMVRPATPRPPCCPPMTFHDLP